MTKIVNKTEEISKMVKSLSGIGSTHDMICSIANISKPTLYKYYAEEIEQGKASSTAKVANNLYRMATGEGKEALTACIFWLKTQCNWTEKQVLEVTDGSEQDDKFAKLIGDIQRAKLAEKDSDNTSH